VINDNWHRISYRFGIIAAYCSKFGHCVFERSAIFDGNRPFCVFETPLGDLGATYDDHLRLIGKRVVHFLLVLTELFSLGVTAEELQANIG